MTAELLYLETELTAALSSARHLASSGVRLFLCRPAEGAGGDWDPSGGTGGTGYWLPEGWQTGARADVRVVDRWQPGMALCAVMGDVVDGVDVDPRSGGDLSRLPMPKSWGRAVTPSGGTHDLVATLGVHSRDGILPGVDFKAGVGGEGCGFLFLAPTQKVDKRTGEVGRYEWAVAPQLDELVLGDDSGEALRGLVVSRTRVDYDGPGYSGPGWDELSAGQRAWAEQEVEALVGYWAGLLEEALRLPEGGRDGSGRGWEALCRDWAWVAARVASASWTGIDGVDAHMMYIDALPSEMAELYSEKWDRALLARASASAAMPPPWDGLDVVRDRESVDASNSEVFAEWLWNNLGMEGTPLAGMFRKGMEVVHTPRMGEDGYRVLSRGERDQDGPAQVHTASHEMVAHQVRLGYRVTKMVRSRGTREPVLPPQDAVRVICANPTTLPNLRELRGVTHTPMMRADGSVLDVPGYDPMTGRLFLPEVGLAVPAVPEEPSRVELGRARDLVLSVLQDFPFNTEHDKANYLALMLTPLMREMVPPPYKMGLINAHQPSSGKSLLAWVLRELHGGVLRGDIPEDAELAKQITSVLASTTAPVVQFDNVKRLSSSRLDALLTTDTWTDRVLGASRDVTMRNDRLWVATGNNISLGGDLVRRALWVTIDPNDPHPEERTDFAITNLQGFVQEHRGALLSGLLTMLRAWTCAGRPTGPRVGEDSYSRWIEACRGVLDVAGVAGVVGHGDTKVAAETDDGEDWGQFLRKLWDQFGDSKFTAKQAGEIADIEDCAPTGMNTSARSVGMWLANRVGQWSGDLTVRAAGHDGADVKLWQLAKYTSVL